MYEQIGRKLSFLGTPVFRGFAQHCFPYAYVPEGGRMVRLDREIKVEGGSVWYGVVTLERKRLVPYMLEPRSSGL